MFFVKVREKVHCQSAQEELSAVENQASGPLAAVLPAPGSDRGALADQITMDTHSGNAFKH